jgi:hypothetical protein
MGLTTHQANGRTVEQIRTGAVQPEQISVWDVIVIASGWVG